MSRARLWLCTISLFVVAAAAYSGGRANGKADRRNVTITLRNEAREAVIRWHAEFAWIKKIEGPGFKAAGNEVAIESLEIAHEGFKVQ